MDSDDASMNNDEMRRFLDAQKNVKYFYGESKNKVEAINRDLEHAGNFDCLLLASDDMIPVLPGYDDIIYHDMRRHYPDRDGVLHYNDGRVGEHLNTLVCCGKKYYDRFGYIYHKDYVSIYADNHFMECSRILKKATYKDLTIIRHEWIDVVGKADELYMRNENAALYEKDKATFEMFKSRNFDLG